MEIGCGLFIEAEDGIRDYDVTGVQKCALPIYKVLKVIQWLLDAEKIRYDDIEKLHWNNLPNGRS